MGNLQSWESRLEIRTLTTLVQIILDCSWQHLLQRRRNDKDNNNNNNHDKKKKKIKEEVKQQQTTNHNQPKTIQQQLLTTLFQKYFLLQNKIKTDNPQVANCYSRHALVTAVAFWMLTRKKLILRRNKKKANFFLLSASENTILADLNKIQEIRPSDFKRYWWVSCGVLRTCECD